MAEFETQDTFSKVTEIIANKLKIDTGSIASSSTLQNLGADSLDMVEIIMKFEEQFGIEVNDEDAQHLDTVKGVVEYVHRLRKK